MCNGSKHLKRPKEFEPDLTPKRFRGVPYDLILVSKENRVLKAHKFALARNKFWRELLSSLAGASGVCPGDAVTVLLPDFEYNAIRLHVMGHYKENVKVSQADMQKLQELTRSLNQGFENESIQCRICKEDVKKRFIVHHVTEHIKFKAHHDIITSERNQEGAKCTFTSPDMCRLEKDRTVVINGIFNNVNCKNHDEMASMIRGHYRRHLRDEFTHLRKACSSNFPIPSDSSLYHLANISDRVLPGNHKRRVEHEGTSGYAGRVENEEDDYSGGMSSPDLSSQYTDRSSSDSDNSLDQEMEEDEGDEKSPVGEGGGTQSHSSSVSPSSSQGEETEKTETFSCRECKMNLKSKGGFRKHIIHKHIYTDLRDFILKTNEVDIENFTCKSGKSCEKNNKKFKDERSLIGHLATIHNQVETYLASIGDSIASWDISRSKSRHASGASEGNRSRGDSRASNHQQTGSRMSQAESRKSTESGNGNESDHQDNEEDDEDDRDSNGSDIWAKYEMFRQKQNEKENENENSSTSNQEDAAEKMEEGEEIGKKDQDQSQEKGQDQDQDSEDDRETMPPDVEPDQIMDTS